MQFSRLERETIVRIDESENEWTVYTASMPYMRKLSKISIPTRVYEDKDGVYAMEFRLPKKAVSFRRPRVLTEEQKKKLELARAKREAS